MLLAVDVTPARDGPSLIVGKLWLDADDGGDGAVLLPLCRHRSVGGAGRARRKETRRSARRANRLINRLLTLDADLEYALQDGRYWMPYRQVLSGRVTIPLVGDLVIPFEAVTTFRDYEINTGQAAGLLHATSRFHAVAGQREGALKRAGGHRSSKARRRGEVPDSLVARDYSAAAGRVGATRSTARRPTRSPVQGLGRHA